jgi:tetratricopeptide (TPR) repeat protein
VDDRFEAADALREQGELLAAIEIYDAIDRDLESDSSVEAQEFAAQALIEKANVLCQLDRFDEAADSYDLVSERYGDSDEVDLETEVARALVRKARTLREQGRLDEAIALSDATIARFSSGDDSDLRLSVANAYATQVECLADLARPVEAIDVARELSTFVEGAYQPVVVRFATWALFHQAAYLGRLGRNDEALVLYHEILETPIDDDDDWTADTVLLAAIDLTNLLRGLRRTVEADAQLAAAIERFIDQPGELTRTRVTYALYLQGHAFWIRGLRDEALAAYERIFAIEDQGRSAYPLGLALALRRRARSAGRPGTTPAPPLPSARSSTASGTTPTNSSATWRRPPPCTV